jgi:hypothetical protein
MLTAKPTTVAAAVGFPFVTLIVPLPRLYVNL